MKRSTLRALAWICLFLLAAPYAQARKPKVPEPELFQLDPQLRTQVEVTERVWAREDLRGLSVLLPTSGALVIWPGIYPVQFGIRSGDREWLLVPYVLRSHGVESSPDTSNSIVSGCTSRFRRYLALDRATRQFATNVWRMHHHSCASGVVEPSTEGQWSQRIKFDRPGIVAIHGYGSAVEAQAGVLQEQEAQRQQVEDERAAEALNTPRKREIGTRLCRRQDSWELVGYTEGVSPDNGKLKIRIADQVMIGAPDIRPGDFREQTIWDAPENWRLCE